MCGDIANKANKNETLQMSQGILMKCVPPGIWSTWYIGMPCDRGSVEENPTVIDDTSPFLSVRFFPKVFVL